MASFTVQCPKISATFNGSLQPNKHQPQASVSFIRSDLRSTPAILPRLQGPTRFQSEVFKVCAQLNEVVIEKSNNSIPISEKNKEEVPKPEYSSSDASSIQEFMSQASDLVKLVDSRDIVELQLKQYDCEIVIKKKEALPQPTTTAAPVYMAPPSFSQAPQMPPISAPAPAAPASSAPALPAPSKPKSSHPPMSSPMAGTFYRSPAPGAPPFVKVGDKVQKGQVVCIVEAMKLMNEIEAGQSGTIVEVLAEDGKPVSVDTPLFTIEP